MWVVLLLPLAWGLRIEADYSAYSGLVASFQLGSLRAPLKLSVGFDREQSFIYPPALCPAFVTCVDPLASSSYTAQPGADPFEDAHLEWSSDLAGSDLLSAGSQAMGRMDFRIVTSSLPQRPSFREVAGAVSLNRHSELMLNKVVTIRSRSFGFFSTGITAEFHDAAVADTMGVATVDPDHWVMEATVTVLGVNLGPFHVGFSPHGRRMFLPHVLRRMLIERWRDQGILVDTRTANRLLVPCSVIADTILQLSNGVAIRIAPVQLIGRVASDTCEVMVKFHDDPRVIIGSQLTDSVSEIVLDNVRNSISISPRSGRWISPFLTDALVPVFRDPEFTQDGLGTISVRFPKAQGASGLFLGFETPIESDVQQSRIYWLVRTGLHTKPPVRFQLGEADGLYVMSERLGLNSAGDLIAKFALSEFGGQLWFASRAHTADLVLVGGGVGHLLSLPEPTIRTEDAAADNPCSICLEAVLKGQTEQGLHACSHSFHAKCLAPWLKSHSSCPTCRAVIEPV